MRHILQSESCQQLVGADVTFRGWVQESSGRVLDTLVLVGQCKIKGTNHDVENGNAQKLVVSSMRVSATVTAVLVAGDDFEGLPVNEGATIAPVYVAVMIVVVNIHPTTLVQATPSPNLNPRLTKSDACNQFLAQPFLFVFDDTMFVSAVHEAAFFVVHLSISQDQREWFLKQLNCLAYILRWVFYQDVHSSVIEEDSHALLRKWSLEVVLLWKCIHLYRW